MSLQKKRYIENFNWLLISIVGALLFIGVLNLYSALYIWGEEGLTHLFISQVVWLGLGMLALIGILFIDYRIFDRISYPLYWIMVGLLVLTLLIGKEVAGHKSWIGFGGFAVQPSEFAKLTYILVAAKFFSDNPNPDGYKLFELWRPAILMLIPFGLVVLQGDLGSGMFFILTFVSLAWFAKIRTKTVVTGVIIGIIVAFISFQYILSDYQRARISSFVHPGQDVRGAGYHLTQSKIAVGSGKFFGKGYLKGNINKLRYLPEKHTDFVFSVLAEEWGFFGSFITLGLYLSLLLVGVDIARKSKERFGTFLAIGIVSLIFWQIVINLGGVLGIIPMTGVTLPFLSYGGSSTISALVSVGVLMNISMRRFMF